MNPGVNFIDVGKHVIRNQLARFIKKIKIVFFDESGGFLRKTGLGKFITLIPKPSTLHYFPKKLSEFLTQKCSGKIAENFLTVLSLNLPQRNIRKFFLGKSDKSVGN